MKDPNRPERPRSRVKTGKKATVFFVSALVIAFAISILFFLLYKKSNIVERYAQHLPFQTTRQPATTSKTPTGNANTIAPQQKTTGQLSTSSDVTTLSSTQNISVPPAGDLRESASIQHQGDTKSDQIPISPKPLESQKKGTASQQLVDELNAFYSQLDRQSYVQTFHLPESSKNHFSKLLQVLIDNPPAITRETDDYFTLLKNTAHFFRVLGKDNIFYLKGILDREKDAFERILKTFYSLTDHPEYLKREFSLSIPKDNLYDYAGFFLNTIGGRLYLFRRDSASRMTVSYYAVLIIDKANRQGYNRLGIDLRPAIDSLIEEMENAGSNLKLKEEYLDTLFDLKEFYGNRG